MKLNRSLSFLAFAAILFFQSSCEDEDGFYNERYLDTDELVTIIEQPDYNVGQNIYVSADFPAIIDEPGQTTPLDLFASSGGAQAFTFSYTLEKETTPQNWTPVEISTSQLDVVNGSAVSGSFVLADAEYNSSDESYEYYVGLPLASSGNYRLSFGVNSDATDKIELRSKSSGNELFLNLISSNSQLNQQGYYTFTVN